MENNILKYKEYIAFYLYCLPKGYIRHEEIVAWADSILFKVDKAPYFIYDLSLSKTIEEQYFIINNIAIDNGISIKDMDKKLFFSQIKKIYETRTKTVCQLVKDIYYFFNELSDNFPDRMKEDIYLLDHYATDLFPENLISEKELIKSFETFLSKYV